MREVCGQDGRRDSHLGHRSASRKSEVNYRASGEGSQGPGASLLPAVTEWPARYCFTLKRLPDAGCSSRIRSAPFPAAMRIVSLVTSRMTHGRARGHPRSDERDDPHRGRERRASDPRTAACVGQAPEREAIRSGSSGHGRQQTRPRPLRPFTRCSIVDSLFPGGAPMRKVRIAPSILSADFAHLADEIASIDQAGADLVHVDVMDGHFVPNLTVGPPIVEALRKVTALPLDVHLMMTNPDAFIREFAEAGATYLTVHVEACPHLHRTVQSIKEKGVQAGVTLNPATPLTSVEEILPDVDLLLIMSVNPGFGGQRFIVRVLDKIKQARAMIDRTGRSVLLEVDGGVKVDNAAAIVAAGDRKSTRLNSSH